MRGKKKSPKKEKQRHEDTEEQILPVESNEHETSRIDEAWQKYEREIEAKVSWLFDLYEKHGHMEHAGEKVSQLQHAQQAAQLARNACQPIHVILGAFFLDIGRLVCIERHAETMTRHGLLMDGPVTSIGTRSHEKIGADFLNSLPFPRCVTDLVRGHVNAKRYLVFKQPEYYDRLSPTSQLTLELHQGGPMSEEEAEEFEQNANFHTLLDLRRFDEGAKVAGIEPTDNSFYKEACKKLLLAEKMNLVMEELASREDLNIPCRI